jgi:hypothetical protein
LAPGRSSGLPGVLGIELDDIQEGSWRRYFVVLALLGPITSCGTVQDSHFPFSRVTDPLGEAPSLGGEGLSPRVLELEKKGFCLC